MLTNGQKRALHAAAREAGIEEWARREIQQRIGGFYSAADRSASREGYIAVMAFYESRCGGRLSHSSPGYWAGEDARANPTDALAHKAVALARGLGLSPEQLDDWIAGPHMSSGAAPNVQDASAYWLRRAIEGLKAIGRRRATG